ncbi:MAG: hypothetical protein WCJ61_06410, partial [Paludibacter sp.]
MGLSSDIVMPASSPMNAPRSFEIQPIVNMTPNGVLINLEKMTTVKIFTLNGILIENQNVKGTYSKLLPKGIYIVLVDGYATKIII